MKHLYTLILVLLYTLAATAQPRIVTTIAGQPQGVLGGDSCNSLMLGLGGFANNATLSEALDICTDTIGNIFFVNQNGAFKINSTSNILSQVAGGGSSLSDTVLATAASASFRSICFDHNGNLWLAYISVIKLNLSTGYFDVVAGSWPPNFGYSGDGGPATSALTEAYAIALDNAENLYMIDKWHSVVRKVNAVTGIITTIAGDGISSFSGDGGPASAARLNKPEDIITDTAGNIYIADVGNFRVRKIDAASGIITTIAGAGGTVADFGGMGGPATSALINRPISLAFDDTGYLYIGVQRPSIVGSTLSPRILKVNLNTGIISQWAGGIMSHSETGYPGDGLDADSAYLDPQGMCFDTSGNMLIADLRCRIRKVWMPTSEGGGGGDTTGGGDTSTTYVHKTVRSGMRIYPNPTRNELHIGNVDQPATYTLYTITGVPALQGALAPKEEHTLMLQQYPPGIYLLHVQQQNGERVVVRVLKE